jgi:Flp pilus assembly protein TadG
MNRIRMRLQSDEKGQALIILTLFFLFVFLVFAALAVDGTIIYLRRRQLQNTADASALAAAEYLGKDKNEAAAYQVAMDSIAENGGRIDWYSTLATANPISTNVGSGVNLVKGIEISDDCNVRVALQWSDMGTYFTQFFGRQTLQVGANAHAACNRAGGLVPIAIKRFGDERDWNMNLNNVNSAKIYCDECDTRESLTGPPGQGKKNSTEFLRPESSVMEYEDTIFEWPPGQMMYKPPANHADKSNGKPGRDFWVLGNGVAPNRGTIAYAGLINLDIRHVSSPPMEYYNGVDPSTNSNTLKDLGEHYIRNGYCCDIPAPGDEVAMYNGTSAAFSPQALRQTYREGDVIAVIVFNGHVFNTPDLIITGDEPNYKATYPTTDTITSDVLTYSIHLEADGFQSSPAGLTMSVEGLEGFADWDFSPTSSPVVGRDDINERWLTLTVTPRLTHTTVGTTTVSHVITGTRMFYVSAIDDNVQGTDLHRYWVGFATIGDTINGTPRDAPAVTCAPTNAEGNGPFIATVKGQQAKYELELDLWGVTGEREVTVSAGALPGNLEWVGAPPWNRGANPNKHPGGKLRLNLKTPDNVVTNTIHTIPLSVSAPGIPEAQTCNLYVLVEEAGSTVKDYVEILGYAALEIEGYYNNEHPVTPGQNPNAVRGHVVGELMSSPPDLTYGLRARLIPWDF